MVGLAAVETVPPFHTPLAQLHSIFNTSYRTTAVVSLQTAHTKHSVTQPSVPDIVRRPNKRAGMQADGQVGSATGGQ